MNDEKERLRILEMIDSGVITADEGLRLLDALQGVPIEPSVSTPVDETESEHTYEASSYESGFKDEPEPVIIPEVLDEEDVQQETPSIDPGMDKWRNWWWIPMWVGVGIMVVSALLMYWAWESSGVGFWFACTWFPFTLGVIMMAMAWASRSARWLHVRITQKPGERPQKIAISLPLPIRLTSWFLRIFGRFIPQTEVNGLDGDVLAEAVLALETTSPEAPFYVEVNEGEDGERVEVYIG
jgi:hypothetical protein